MIGDQYDVVIVGAGPTGLTLANLLGLNECSVLVVERNTTTVQEPRAVSIDDESLRTMQSIGLVSEVVKDVALDYGSHYLTSSGKYFLSVEPSTREFGFPRRNAFTQPRLEAVLRNGLARFPTVTALFDCDFKSYGQDREGVTVALTSGNGESLEVRCKYLVGCDGARGGIRKSIGAELGGSTYRQKWLIVDLAATKERLRQTRVVSGLARPLITLPGPNGIRRYEFMLHEGEDELAQNELSFTRQLLAENGPDGDAPIVRRQVYHFHARIADKWRQDRVLIAGDAAHLSPPFAGQGMNSGIRDAHNLGWKLSEVVQGRLGADLLDTYQAERLPHAWSLIELAMNMGRIMMPRSRLEALIVPALLQMAQVVPRVQAYFAQMKYKPKPYYKTGFVVGESELRGIVGRMLPQPLVEKPDRSCLLLDDMRGTGFLLLAYGADAQLALGELSRYVVPLSITDRIAITPRTINPVMSHPVPALRDVNGTLASFVRDDRTVVMLVRPDHYVANAAPAAPQAMEAFVKQSNDLIRAIG